MFQSQSATDRFVTPDQVWADLPIDLRSHAIRLLAHLACTYAAACPEPASQKESYVIPPVSNQDPPRPS